MKIKTYNIKTRTWDTLIADVHNITVEIGDETIGINAFDIMETHHDNNLRVSGDGVLAIRPIASNAVVITYV